MALVARTILATRPQSSATLFHSPLSSCGVGVAAMVQIHSKFRSRTTTPISPDVLLLGGAVRRRMIIDQNSTNWPVRSFFVFGLTNPAADYPCSIKEIHSSIARRVVDMRKITGEGRACKGLWGADTNWSKVVKVSMGNIIGKQPFQQLVPPALLGIPGVVHHPRPDFF